MSLLDDVSIVVTPNGYKAGELYAVIPVPTEGAELVEDGSFPSGTSNWSEGTGWSLTDGYANASSASGELSQSGIDFDTSKRYYIQYTISGYSGSGGVKARFKGAVWNTGELREENGTFTEVLMSTAENNVFSFVTSSSFTGSISNVSVKEYTSADMDVTRATDATRVNESGLIEDVLANVPRIDYTGGGCPHILAEPQRTNLVAYSEDLTQWNIGNSTISPNDVTSPDGTQNADTIIVPDTNDFIYEGATTIASTEYVFSFYVKRGTIAESALKLAVRDDTNSAWIDVDVSYSSSDSEWTRITQSFTTPVGCILIRAYAFRNGSSTLGTFSVWGAQVEQGSYATSYIPTDGGTVTRVQDQYSKTGISNLINSEEGVLFAEMAALSDDSTNRQLTLSDGTDTNRIVLKYDNQSNIIQSFNRVSGVETASLSATVSDITQFSKIAIKYKLNDYAMWIDGVEVDTDNSSTTFPSSTLNKLSFGTSSSLFAKVKQLQIFKTALTDPELVTLTT